MMDVMNGGEMDIFDCLDAVMEEPTSDLPRSSRTDAALAFDLLGLVLGETEGEDANRRPRSTPAAAHHHDCPRNRR